MKPKAARALLVVAVFAALAVLSATGVYVNDAGHPKGRIERQAVAPWKVFQADFRYYTAWALLAPGILWLARRVPFRRRSWPAALAVHLPLSFAACLPLFVLRVSMASFFGQPFPSWTLWLSVPWGRIFLSQGPLFAPVYWLLLGAFAAAELSRTCAANQVRASQLRRSLAAAQRDALKMKLQPHFLFNTLNAVASLAQAGDTGAVVRVVERLGTLLRLSMETSNRQFVTLEEELALLDEYLAIEEIRFNERLRIVHRIDPQTRKALVPNLVLQPLVENALVHGLARRLESSLLEIATLRQGPELHIAVRDDGPGLPPGWSLASAAGAGLQNVLDRLEGLYAGAFRFVMENGPTGGVVARLSVPFVETEAAVAESSGHG